VGFVRTEAYGQITLFRVDIPALPAREHVLDSPQYINASSEKSVGHRYAPMGTGSSAREPDVGYRGFSFPVLSQLPFELVCPLR
jgi:hypothetical protein